MVAEISWTKHPIIFDHCDWKNFYGKVGGGIMENIQRLENMTKGEVDLNKARESAVREFNCELAEANKIWYGVLRLIITLASSFLVLTLALVEKIFPLTTSQTTLPKLLILSWVLLFCAIIFGIIAELNELIFCGHQAARHSNYINDCTKKILEGKQKDSIEVDLNSSHMVSNSIVWGVISINCFILAIIFMCVALLAKIFSGFICAIILSIAVIFIFLVNKYLLNKRKNLPVDKPR